MHVILLAGGKNERFEHLSVFPKVILPFMYEDKPTTVLKYYSDRVSELTVLVHINYMSQVCGYVKANGLKNVKVCATENQDGSFWTLNEAFKLNHVDSNKPYMYVWSDLLIDSEILKRRYTGNTLFTRHGKYRLKTFHAKLTECPDLDGNIPGVFYIQNWNKFYDEVNQNYNINDFDNSKGFDLAQAFHYTVFKTKQIKSHIKELRDLKTYVEYTKDQKVLTRGFNNILFRKDSVTKSTDYNHRHLIQGEVNWYKELPKYNLQDIAPKLLCFSNQSITLERLPSNYKPLFKFGHDGENQIIQKLLTTVYDTFAKSKAVVVDEVDYLDDVTQEMVTKTLDRLEVVKPMLLHPNALYHGEIAEALHKANEIILSETEPVYHFFHGDLNGSNIMYNGEDFKFLDPRGYFGQTKLLGPIWYERAKIIYAVTGYDAFNQQFNYTYVDKENYSKPIRLFLDFDEITAFDKIVVGIIYLSLTSYIADNIMKVNIAYQYGWNLLQEGLAQYENEKSEDK